MATHVSDVHACPRQGRVDGKVLEEGRTASGLDSSLAMLLKKCQQSPKQADLQCLVLTNGTTGGKDVVSLGSKLLGLAVPGPSPTDHSFQAGRGPGERESAAFSAPCCAVQAE